MPASLSRRFLGLLDPARLCVALLAGAISWEAVAQQPANRSLPPRPVVSPEILPSRDVVFRLRAPSATRVELSVVSGKSTPMAKDEAGMWTVTLEGLEPDLYRYNFIVDGLRITDPVNPAIDVGRNSSTSLADVPGSPARIDERRAEVGGSLHVRYYPSAGTGVSRRMFVHVPAAYDREPNRRFPVLYLRHGNGDLEGSWAELGRAGVILDNLVAAGRAVPMIIVMPNGYADPGRAASAASGPAASDEATSAELLGTIIPFIEKNYRVLADPANRAVAGLSMGGGQAFLSGLNHPGEFAWVGAFSSGVVTAQGFDLAKAVPGLVADAGAANARIKLLFLTCGTEDSRHPGHLRLVETLRQAGIRHETHSLPGGHEWKVWRRSLAELLPKLFQPSAS